MENNQARHCYSCGSSGHFSNNCPRIFIGHKTTANSSTAEFPVTYCPCGGGLCLIKVTSTNNKDRAFNAGRAFYCCPGINERHCEYFKWCDELKAHEILDVQPNPYPICSCRAGISRIETERTGPYTGRKYFACNIKKGDGACSFRKWQDDYNASVLFNENVMKEIQFIQEAFENFDLGLDFC